MHIPPHPGEIIRELCLEPLPPVRHRRRQGARCQQVDALGGAEWPGRYQSGDGGAPLDRVRYVVRELARACFLAGDTDACRDRVTATAGGAFGRAASRLGCGARAGCFALPYGTTLSGRRRRRESFKRNELIVAVDHPDLPGGEAPITVTRLRLLPGTNIPGGPVSAMRPPITSNR
jgi:hypothetical protein